MLNLDIPRDIMPLTIGEIENTRKLEKASKTFADAVNRLIRLEAMKAANQERINRGESLAYSEESFLNLLDE